MKRDRNRPRGRRPTAPLPPPRRSASVWAVAAILTIAAALAYGNSLSGAFVLDDIPAIAENPHIRSLIPLADALTAPPRTTVSGRPVVSLSLALNHALSRAPADQPPSPRALHVGNIVIHVLAAFALVGVVRRTLSVGGSVESGPAKAGPYKAGPESGPAKAGPYRAGPYRAGPYRAGPYYRADSLILAAAIALLWLVHPLQTAAVTYIVQRAEALMGLFLMLTLYCAIRAHESRSTMWTVAAVIACALGTGSKEVMVVAPLLVVAWDWVFASKQDPWRAVLARRWPLYAGLAATWLMLAWQVSSARRSGSVGFGFEQWPWWRYLATQAGVILHYLKL